MKKKIIISIGLFGLFIIILAIGAYFYIQEQNEKLSLSYAISQCKAEDEGAYEESDDSSWNIYKGTKYDCYNKDYNQIIKFKKDKKSSQETYAFRVETAESLGNDGDKFNYEIGRIVIDTTNPKVSKCTYNYRGSADWRPCTEQELIKSLPEISLLKSKAYEILKPLLKEINERDADSYYGSGGDTQYNDDKLEEACEKYKKQLNVLRNTTLK